MIVSLSLALLPLAQASGGGIDAAATIAQARRLIEAQDYPSATVLLEEVLPEANAKNRPEILDLLRQSYEVMAREAQAAGRDRDAAQYRDNLAIIERCRRPAAPVKPNEEKPKTPANPQPLDSGNKTSGATATAQSRAAPRNIALVASAQDSPPLTAQPPPAPLPEPAPMPVLEPIPRLPKQLASPNSPTSNQASEPSRAELKNNDPNRALADLLVAAPQAAELVASTSPHATKADAGPARPGDPKPRLAEPSLEEGDRLFKEKRYEQAGRCYAALARQKHLPARRTEHWAYCRMVEVARRINARPKSAREWDEIEGEIVSIQRLSPNIWYGEYLRNKVAEVRRAVAQADSLVVRGTAPDESRSQQATPPRRLPRIFGKARDASNSQAPAEDSPAAATNDAAFALNLPGPSSPPEAASAPNRGGGADLGAAAGQGVAGTRPLLDAGVKRAGAEKAASSDLDWQVVETPNFRVYHLDARLGEAAGQAAESVRAAQAKHWGTSAVQRPWTPPCEVYLYPTGKVFARMTNQPENSPGFSTMMCNGNRVVARRTNLRADHPQLLTAILPHEITHVVLADLFTVQQIPRWADEGIAVLAEPRAEQQIRAAELEVPLEAGQVFELKKLMDMDYPDAKDWSLYYAQSVSLTRFLVELGQPEQFVRFVRDSQRDGIEGALRATYRIAGFAELQERWTEYARRQLAPLKEARRVPNSQSPRPVDR